MLRSRRFLMHRVRIRATARPDQSDRAAVVRRPAHLLPTLGLPRQLRARTSESHGGKCCKTWLFLTKCDEIIPGLREKFHKFSIDLLRMSPQHAVRAVLEFDERDILDQLCLSSGRGVCRKDAISIAVQNERWYGVASDVLAEILDPGIDASPRSNRRCADRHVPVTGNDLLAHELGSGDIVVVKVV